jgi:hypothetical protein
MPDWIGDQMAGVGPEATRGLRPECANSGHSSRPGKTGRRLAAAIRPLVWCNLAWSIGVMWRRRGNPATKSFGSFRLQLISLE